MMAVAQTSTKGRVGEASEWMVRLGGSAVGKQRVNDSGGQAQEAGHLVPPSPCVQSTPGTLTKPLRPSGPPVAREKERRRVENNPSPGSQCPAVEHPPHPLFRLPPPPPPPPGSSLPYRGLTHAHSRRPRRLAREREREREPRPCSMWHSESAASDYSWQRIDEMNPRD